MSQSQPLVTRRLTLAQDMTIYHALEQKSLLLDALSEGETLELDLSQVAAIDTAGLQLLLLIKRESSLAGKQLKLTGHSPPVRELIEFTQLAGHFGDPMVIPRCETA